LNFTGALGLDVSMVGSRYAMSGDWWRTNRTPFREGYVSESVDGQPVAPLMGTFTDPDVGNARANTYPNFWLHGSSDHMHTMRVTPIGATTTQIQADWLVAGDAEAGVDYEIESGIAFSNRVNDEDRDIVEAQARGIASSRYQPVPIHRSRKNWSNISSPGTSARSPNKANMSSNR
jgi:Rieske 2Fe-2S family protein